MSFDPLPFAVGSKLRLNPWSLAIFGGGLLVVGLPLGNLFWGLAREPESFRVWLEFTRISRIAKNSALYAFGALAIALPFAFLVAYTITRATTFLRQIIFIAVVFCLFIPSPVLVAAWRPIFTWSRLEQGLMPAIILQAILLFPWMVLPLVHAQLRLPKHLIEDAFMTGGPPALFRHVYLPALLDALIAVALLGLIQVFHDITTTNLFQVNTFAEEVYIQFSRPDPAGTTNATGPNLAAAVCLPVAMVMAIFLWATLRRLRINRFFQQSGRAEKTLRLRNGEARLLPFIIALFLLVFLSVPLMNLVHLAGLDSRRSGWSILQLFRNLATIFNQQTERLLFSFTIATVTGLIASAVGLVVSEIVRRKTTNSQGILIALLLLWGLPGPLLGMGLKTTIDLLIHLEESLGLNTELVQQFLYVGPSPVPVIWAQFLRLLPLAVVLWLPTRSRTKTSQQDAAHTDGATARLYFLTVFWPAARAPYWLIFLVVAALSLGELSTSKLVTTPDGDTLAMEIFMQLHYSLNHMLAATCLVLLIPAIATTLILNRYIRFETISS